MRFLVDNCLSPHIASGLRMLGHDAIHLRDLNCQNAEDKEVLDTAAVQDRVLMTADADFGAILALEGKSRPSVILFRHMERSPTVQLSRAVQLLSEIEPHLNCGAIVVVESVRIRVRPLPIEG